MSALTRSLIAASTSGALPSEDCAIAFNTYFRNRITQVMLEVGHVADDLLTQMYHNSKKPGVPASPATAMPAAPAVAAATPVAAAPAAPPPR